MGIVNLSEADLDPSIITGAWLKKQANPEGIEYFMDDFYRSIDYIEKLKNKSLMSSKVGLINSGLEFVSDCVNKEQFCVGLARGLGSTLRQEDRNGFCLTVRFLKDFLKKFFNQPYFITRSLNRLTFTSLTKTKLNYAPIMHSKIKLSTTLPIRLQKQIK